MNFTDDQFFKIFPDRQAHIRMPDPYNECAAAFHDLGDHPRHRRRILLYKVPKENPLYDAKRPQVLKIPFLCFADETLEDRDDILLPIIATIMMEQLAVQGGRQ